MRVPNRSFRWMLFAFLVAHPTAGQERWIGELRGPDGPRALRVQFTAAAGTLEFADGLLPDGSGRESPWTVRSVTRDGTAVRFEALPSGAAAGSTPLRFAGEVRPEASFQSAILAGKVEGVRGEGTFTLLRLAALDRTALDRLAGLYEFTDGSFVLLRFLEDIQALTYVLFPSGRLGPLSATSPTTLVSGASLGKPFPVAVRLEIEPTGLRWHEAGTTRQARRLRDFPAEEVAIANGEVRLAGTLTRPHTPPPHPAVVLLHGGGPQSRDFFWVAPLFNHLGVAVLAYDKRGVGGSTGNWREAGTAELAADGLAALAFARKQPGIDARRVGFYGSSNGGWVAPYAAARQPDDVAFVIVRSASGIPERENIVYEAETDLRARGFGNAEVARMRALHEREMALVQAGVQSGGVGWNEYRAELEAAAREPWFEKARLPASVIPWNPENRTRIETWIANEWRRWFQPADVWRKVVCPVLVQNGADDEYVPGERSADTLREALRQGGNAAATVHLFPRANHALFELPGTTGRDLGGVERYAAGYLEELMTWVRRWVVKKPI